MILKSFLIEKNLSSLDKHYASLFYGENMGLKDEIKEKIISRYRGHEKIILNQSEIVKNEKILNEHIYNTSLFNKNKIIFINDVSEKIKKKILEIISEEQNNIKIFLFSQNLDKKSSLRNNFEKSKNLAIIPCYQDNERTLSEYVRSKLQEYKGLNQNIINLLISNSGLDRKVLINEIEKIRSLFINKEIQHDKILKLINNPYNTDFDDLRDACLEADKSKLNKNLGNVTFQNEDSFFYLNSLNLRFQKLMDLSNQFKIDNNLEIAMENLRPKIFWKDKPIFQKQIKKWNLKKLEEGKKMISEVEIAIKTKFGGYNDIIIKNLLISLCAKANS
tara:strand:+ start:504 stop:1502 length:999 start_codon:yes stop_codon:yes gene_type:complete